MRKYKSKIYTAAMVTLSLFVVLGGWFFTREMLDRKKCEFLSGSGAVALRSAQTSLLAQEDAPFQTQELPEELMREILLLWRSGGKEMPHEPKEGQMNMEQAIEAGRKWIAVLADREVVPPALKDGDFDKIRAQLSTFETPTDLDERLVSRWTMEYLKDDVYIKLTIHAMSGEIWEADIHMSAASSKAHAYSSEGLLEMMFPRLKDSNLEKDVYDNYGWAKKDLKQGIISAYFYFETMLSKEMPEYELAFWLEIQKFDSFDTDSTKLGDISLLK